MTGGGKNKYIVGGVAGHAGRGWAGHTFLRPSRVLTVRGGRSQQSAARNLLFI